MPRKLILSVAAVAVMAGAGAGGTWWVKVGRYQQSTDDAYVQSDISVVSPKVAGYVAELKVEDNQPVHAGDVLVVIDPQDYRAAVAEAEGQLAGAEAAIQTIGSQLQLQNSVIAQQQASVASDEAELTRARGDLARYQDLVSTGVASRQKLDQVRADVAKAEAAVGRSKAAVATETSRVGVLETQRREAEAKRAEAQAALDADRINLENTVIRAPVDGIVGNKGVQLGQYVRQGTELLSVVPADSLYVVANYKETQLAAMHPGQAVEITVDAVPGHVFEGRIASLAPASGAQFSLLPPENATGNFTKIVQRVPVKIALTGDDPAVKALRPGLSVVATTDTRTSGPVPVLRRPVGSAALTLAGARYGQ